MTPSRSILGSLILVISLNVGAQEATQPIGIHGNGPANLEPLAVLRVAPCKASGDGTYVEMITTMASVLPPAEAEAFLARYCEACNRRKFTLSQTR